MWLGVCHDDMTLWGVRAKLGLSRFKQGLLICIVPSGTNPGERLLVAQPDHRKKPATISGGCGSRDNLVSSFILAASVAILTMSPYMFIPKAS